MKQKFFLMAMSGLALAACTQVENVPEVHSNNAIGFENVVNKNSRAVTGDLTINNFDLFSVYGYYVVEGKESTPVLVFDGTPVNKVADTEAGAGKYKWTYSPERFWNPGAEYFFYAYSCADVAMTPEEDYKFGKPVLDLTQNKTEDRALDIQNYVCTPDHQHDLIVAKNEGMKGMEKTADVSIKRTVAFKFEHALSKINVVFTSKFPVGYDIIISDVKIVNYYDKADFDFDHMQWKNRTIAETTPSIPLGISKGGTVTSQTMKEDGTYDATSVTTDAVFMIPMNYSQDDANNKDACVDLQFTIDVQQNGVSFLNRNLKAQWQPNWQKGTAYTYYVDLGGKEAQLEPIVFESTQDMADPGSWGANQRVDMTFSLN